MCGIFGMIARGAPVLPEVLERATQALAHRGPDDGGTIILHDDSEAIEIGLGNRRLAILDLSPLGHQPMNDPATGNWIVYNGEIYNFREVRNQLQQEGHHFISLSDTEVILRAYAHWGERCVHQFRGMFAFAIWDAARHRLFAARDPMGIKPFYFYQSDRYFLFSSEVRALLGTGLVPRRIDPAGLVSYLSFGSLYEPNTLLEGVRSLAPGHFMTWAKGEMTESQYWDLIDSSAADSEVSSGKNREARESEIAQLLDESVRMQLVSDVPVGVFLSGGIDSSVLVSILSRSGNTPATFSIVFREADYSEAEYSREIAQVFHTDHHEITVSQSDVLTAIAPAIHAMDLPTIDGINTYFISEKTRTAGVKVALSGLGGDEMFAGYSSFRTVPRMQRFAKVWSHLPAATREQIESCFAVVAPPNDQSRKLGALSQATVDPYFLSRMLFTANQRRDLLPTIKRDSLDSGRAEATLTDSIKRAQSLDPINRVSYLEARCYMLNTLLRDSDFMSMAHGLEVRVPLIDHRLARCVLALPGMWKLNSGTPKPMLIKALGGSLPDNIVHRAKKGFTLPFEHWLRDELRPVVEASMRKVGEGVLGVLIGERAAFQVWQDFLEGRTSWSRPWSLYVLQSWCEQHLSG